VSIFLSALGTTLVINAMQYLLVFLILPDTVMILSEPKCLKLSIEAKHCIIFCLLQKTTRE
jgi:hypothetical protein